MSDQSKGADGHFVETEEELSFERFFGSLLGHITGYLVARNIATSPTPKKRGKAAAAE